jgi:ribosome-associated protein
MQATELKAFVIDVLEDMKARDIKVLDVSEISGFTDFMVICTGNSSRQVKAIADNVALKAKQEGHAPGGIEGGTAAEWVLIDLGDVIVHVMQQNARDFYQLEKLWGPDFGADPEQMDSHPA